MAGESDNLSGAELDPETGAGGGPMAHSANGADLPRLHATDLIAIPSGVNPDTILIVDDDPITRLILSEVFRDRYKIEEAEDGRIGLAKLLADPTRYCAILLDFAMKGMDGLEMLRHLKARDLVTRIPVFLITSETAFEVTKEAYDLGVMDVIGKPTIPYVVERRVDSVIELYQSRRRLSSTVEDQQSQLFDQAASIIKLSNGMIESLAAAIEFRDGESGEHVRRIRTITRLMLEGTTLGAGLTPLEVDAIEMASMIHDVGKIAIPDAILCKPGRLTPEEFDVIKSHTVVGAELLEGIPQFRELDAYAFAVDIARHHHERWDGRGYPDGLVGDQISIWSQVVALADVYDALRSKRVYKPPFSRERAMEMIAGGECGAFNPQLIETFKEVEPLIDEMYD
ncbi:MAG: response regulator [Eggerthellaceae bacterium]|nr:response regulator [Eggerthellaceae bacterium]